MPIHIFETPVPRPWTVPFPPEVAPKYVFNPRFELGEAICAPPYEAEMFLSFTAPLGKVSGVNLSLAFQLRKWGYVRYKIDEFIFVSPVFKQYYDLTIAQRDQLQAAIKSGLASIAQAIADFELVMHDLRKYREFLDYFKLIEKGKREKNVELETKGNQTLKSIFIDQVDVHTGEGIALKLIAPRWPTVIVDFMRLTDEDVDPKKIAEKYGISEAEGVVLATKNKLYVEWRDRMFKPTVLERYKTLLGLASARMKSIKEYRTMLKPTIARFKMINDALEGAGGRAAIKKSIMRPDAQAVSADYQLLWAWKPFAISEKYKVTREMLDSIPALRAGFNGKEIKELQDAGVLDKKNPVVFGLPMEPSIDRIVREYKKKVEEVYGVRLSTIDLFNAREMLVNQFRYARPALTAIEPWVFSPYFIFINIPILRVVVRLPDGSEFEDVEYHPFFTATYTQNLIIGRCLELIAVDKQLENYIDSLLGEYGVSSERLSSIKIAEEEEFESVEKIVEKEFVEVYKSEEELKKEKEKEEMMKKLEKIEHPKIKLQKLSREIRLSIGKFLANFGIRAQFFRAVGPYEFAMQQRLSKLVQRAPGIEFRIIKDFLKTKFGVHGVTVPW